MSKSVSLGSSLACLALTGLIEIPQINPPSALAQTIVPATDGTNTQVIPNDNEFNIQGGQLSGDGANLFHSFQRFGLSDGQIATFLSNPNIRNIIGRINGGEASLINGLIQVVGGNSNLYLMNPAGIIFGSNAQLNVPAAFTATSATGIGFGNNNWFNAVGNNNWSALVGTPNEFRFDALKPGSIVNFGNLAVGTGESLTLLGGSVINLGTLSAPGGRITVAAVPGKNLVRISQEGRLLSVELPLIPEGERQQGITPLSLPQLLTGANVGNANTISVNDRGQVVLTGSGISVPDVGGTAIVSGTVSSRSQQSVGGEINVLGDRIALLNANINASGVNGGNIFIGGNRSGLGPLPNAQYTFVSPDSVVSADALQQGNGGQIIVFAQDTAQIHGTLTARGGLLGGNGGFIETSGMRLTITSVPNVGATAGLGGEWLIDPFNITIVAGNGNTNINETSPFEPSANNAQLGVDLITAALNFGDVTISTSSGGTQAGDITLSTPLTFNLTDERTLTLNADNDIFINQPIQPAGSNSAPLNLVLNGNNGDLAADVGRVILNGGIGNINTLGGNISIRGRSNSSSGVEISEHLNSGSGDINIIGVSVTQNGSQGVVFNGELRSGGGNISITGDSFNSQGIFRSVISPGNVSIDSAGGNITFNGTSNLRDGIRLTLGVINSGGGDITFNGTSNIFDGIRFGLVSINAGGGNITLNGTSTNLDGLPFNDPNIVSPGGITIGDGRDTPIGSGFNGIVIDNPSQIITTGTGTITLNGTGSSRGILLNNSTQLVTDSGAITLTGKSDPDGFGILVTNGASVQSTSGNITLIADEINLLGTSQFKGSASISLQPFTSNLGITVGGTFTTDDLNIDDSELATFQNGFSQIIIASPDNTETIILNDTTTFNAPVNIAGGATLIGPNRDTTWTITGSNSVSLSGYPNGLTASNIQNLKGGTLNDDFVFNNGQNWGAKIDGDAGIDSLNYSNFTTSLTVDLAALGATGIETVIGTTNATSTLIGADTNNTWNLTGTNSGNINDTLNFSNFQNLVGGTLDDNFVFGDGVNWGGTIGGNTGTDALDYSAFTTDLTVDIAALEATGIETVIGTTNATSNLIGGNANNTWNFSGTNSGRLNNTLNFIEFKNIVGGNLDDMFVLGDGISWSGSIDGKSGIDTLDYSNFKSPINIDLATLNAVNIETIVGTTNATSNLIATNNNNIWNIIDSNSGSLNGSINFRNFQRLTGGTLEDNFIFADGAIWSGIIDGNVGINTLDHSAFTTPLTVNLGTLETTAININNIIGTTNATSTIIGTNENNVWTITANNSGTFNSNINFRNFQQLVGANLNDDFIFNDGINWNGTLDGKNGTDTLNYAAFSSNLVVNLEALEATSIENIVGTNNAASTLIGRNTTNAWILSGNNSGTYNNTLNFSQFQNLTGGDRIDIFVFVPLASISGNISGGAGIMMLIGDEIVFSGTVSGTGDLKIEPLTINQEIKIGGTDSGSHRVLDLTSAELSFLQNGFRSITIGKADGSGTLTLAGDVTFEDPVTLQTLGVITYQNGTLRGADNATITLAAKGDITTGSIINPGRDISIASEQGQIDTTAGTIDSSSVTGDGGAIALTTSGNITTSNLNSSSTATKGGNIALTAETGSITTGNLNSSGVTSGGNVVVQAQTAITSGEINSSATTGNGGNVTLNRSQNCNCNHNLVHSKRMLTIGN
ncbi:beta strand repeat-containing protein [Argonema antarcticum]|uniref:beta strand repeat-containing protein n=1 Tax=Argonema antarcticum TaxID=2942763 RepID=UPI00201376B2|nr:filamentous hemagglutinin N-terminal domain-containing protein [Argonema antarcticum]MCL1471886.1 filamentous hemagglutinin N-terminal domain-containing protein [Argonema antarcticum A004/B2]